RSTEKRRRLSKPERRHLPRPPRQRHRPLQRKLPKLFRRRRPRKRRAAATDRSGLTPKRTFIIRKVPNGTVGPKTVSTRASRTRSRKATTQLRTRNSKESVKTASSIAGARFLTGDSGGFRHRPDGDIFPACSFLTCLAGRRKRALALNRDLH